MLISNQVQNLQIDVRASVCLPAACLAVVVVKVVLVIARGGEGGGEGVCGNTCALPNRALCKGGSRNETRGREGDERRDRVRGWGTYMLSLRVRACTRTVCTLAPAVCEHVAGPAPCAGLISRYNQPPGPAWPGRSETAQDGPRRCTFPLLVLLVAAAAAAAWFVRLRNFGKTSEKAWR